MMFKEIENSFVKIMFIACSVMFLTGGCQAREKHITIRGRISCDICSQGDIIVSVFDEQGPRVGNVLGKIKIPSPGDYELILALSGRESGIKKIIVVAFNDRAGNGAPPDKGYPKGGYIGNPIQLGSGPEQTFSDIDIYLVEPI